MAGDPRSPQRGSGRGYSGYDRYGNYDPKGRLLPSAHNGARDDHDDRDDRDDRGYGGGYGDDFDAADDSPRVRSRSGSTAAGTASFDAYGVPRAARSRAASSAASTPDVAAFGEAAGQRRSRAASSASHGSARSFPTADLRSSYAESVNEPADPGVPLLPKAPAWSAPAALILGPFLGILVGKSLGDYSGPAFAVMAVLATMLATASVTRRALWWVVPAAPPAIWAAAVAAELVLHSPAYQGTKELAVGLVHGTVHAFPVMAAAVVAAFLVVAAERFVAGSDQAVSKNRKATHA